MHVAATFCDMHILMRKDFEKLLARNPMEAFKITEIARVRQVHADILLVFRTELECMTHMASLTKSRADPSPCLAVQTRSGHAISVITSEQNGAKKLTELDVQNKQQMLDVVPVPPDLITRPAVRCCLHCTLVSSGASCCLHVTPAGLWDSWRLLAEAGRPQLVFHTLCA